MRLPKCVLANPRLLGADEAQHHLLVLRHEAQRLEAAGALGVVLEKESVHGGPAEYRLGHRVVSARGHPHAHVIAAAGVHGDAERRRAMGEDGVDDARVLRRQLVRVLAVRLYLGADVLVAQASDSHVVELKVVAAGGGEVADLLAVGAHDVRPEILHVGVDVRRDNALAAAHVQIGRRRDAELRRLLRHRLEVGEVVHHDRLRALHLALHDHHRGGARGLAPLALERHRIVGLGGHDALDAGEEIGVPEGAPELAVSHGAQPCRFLHLHRVADRAVLDLAQLRRADRPLRRLVACFDQLYRAQQAADLVGAERGFPCHGRVPLRIGAGGQCPNLRCPARLAMVTPEEESTMKRIFAPTVAALMLFAASSAFAQTVKIGMILTLTGQFADAGAQLDNGVKTYMKQFGDTVAGRRIEIIRRDTGGVAPDLAKRLAQELIVRDNVDILAGFVLTPNALAAADVSAEAKKFMVVMNAATSIITTKSPYLVRSSVTLPQVAETFGAWAAKNGVKKTYSMVTDYGPGHDFEGAFLNAFKAGGGEVIGSVRFPVANPDFAAFIQRAKDLNPESIVIFVPGGAQPAALGKALAERGIDPKKTKILGSGETTAEAALKSMGDASLGIITAWHYDYKADNARNREFVKVFNEMHGRNPDFFSIGGYDGMHVIYEALRRTSGKADGDSLIAAAKGLKWESPRGPMSIDPETRDVVQNIYIRRVQKVGGELINVPFDKVENVKDPVKARMK